MLTIINKNSLINKKVNNININKVIYWMIKQNKMKWLKIKFYSLLIIPKSMLKLILLRDYVYEMMTANVIINRWPMRAWSAVVRAIYQI